MAKKTWLQKNWDKIGFGIAIILAFYFILKGAGYNVPFS